MVPVLGVALQTLQSGYSRIPRFDERRMTAGQRRKRQAAGQVRPLLEKSRWLWPRLAGVYWT
jgi:hypothetical protein